MSLAEWLAQRGHAVTVIAYADRDACSIEHGFEVRRIRRISKLRRYQRMQQMCAEELRRADLVFTSDHLCAPLVRALKAVPRPSILRVMIDPAWELSSRYGWSDQTPDEFRISPSTYRGAFVALRQRRWWHCFSHLVAPSEYLKRVLCEYGVAEDRIACIKNPYHGTLLLEPNPLRSERTVLIVARLANWKRIDHALREFAGLPPDWNLRILGDGPRRGELEALTKSLGIAARVEFLGACDHATVQKAMRAATVLLQTSSYEGLSHTLLEALAAGLPIVATEVGGNVELLRGGLLGLPLAPNPPWQLAERIPAWIASGLALECAQRGRDTIAREFDRDALFSRMESLCLELIRSAYGSK
jgi:glycosyltransferase involved in cell wall biosynthesis